MLLLTVVGIGFRFYNLGGRSLWLDDAYLYWFMDGTWGDLWDRAKHFHSAPPLFVALIKPIAHWNDSEAGLRFLPAFMGSASIPIFHLLARRLLETEAAVAASALVTMSPTLVYLSREVREYSTVFLLSSLLILLYLNYLDAPSVRRSLVFGGVLSAGLWTHYSIGVLGVALNFAYWQTWTREKIPPRALRNWMVGQVFAASAGVALLALVFQYQFFLGRGQSYLSAGYWSGAGEDLIPLLLIQPIAILTLLTRGLLGVGLALIGLIWWLRYQPAGRWITVSLSLALVASALALLRIYPLIDGRQITYALPFAFVFAGTAVQWCKVGRYRRTAAVICVILCGPASGIESFRESQRSSPEDMRPVMAYLEKAERPGDRIFVTPGATLAFRYYNRHRQHRWIEATPNEGYFDGRKLDVSLQHGIRYAEELQRELAKPGRLWLVASHHHPVEPSLSTVLDSIGRPRNPELVLHPRGAELYLAK